MSKTNRDIKFSIDFDKNSLGIFRSEIIFLLLLMVRPIPVSSLFVAFMYFDNFTLYQMKTT